MDMKNISVHKYLRQALHHKIRKYFHQNEIDLYFSLVERAWAVADFKLEWVFDFNIQKSQQFNN